MTLYFRETAGQSASTLENWFEDESGYYPSAVYPTGADDVYIQSGICSGIGYSGYNSLTVVSGATLDSAGEQVTVNNGTIGALAAVCLENNGQINVNNGTLTLNLGTVTTNNSTIATNDAAVTTNTAGGVVALNNSTVSSNEGQVTDNAGAVTVNEVGGVILNHRHGSSCSTNNGDIKLNIGNIGAGSGTVSNTLGVNLTDHTAGANVTLPSGVGSVNFW